VDVSTCEGNSEGGDAQLIGNRLKVLVDDSNRLLARDLDDELGDDLDDDSEDGEDEKLEDEQEGRVACRDDSVRVRVRRRSLVTRDPSSIHHESVQLAQERKQGRTA
jgi:hypothetical protein